MRACVRACAHACVAVCVCYFRSHRSNLSENKKCKKNTFVDFNIYHRKGIIAKIVLHDLDLHLCGQTFQVAILTSNCWKNANITIAIR